MSTLAELSLPRAVVVIDTDRADAALAASALVAALAETGTAVGSLRLGDDGSVARQALSAAGGDHDVLVAHAPGGLLVPLDARGGTLADVGTALRYKGVSTGAVLVSSGGDTAPNALALTAEALARRELPVIGVVLVLADGPGVPALDRLVTAAGAPVLAVLSADADPTSSGSQGAPGFFPETWGTMAP